MLMNPSLRLLPCVLFVWAAAAFRGDISAAPTAPAAAVLPLQGAAWQFRDATKEGAWAPAIVPGCVHRDLLRNGQIPDPFWGTNELGLQWIEERDWEYRRTFEIAPAVLAAEVVELVADGLDTVATVMLNGQVVARTDNMFIGWRWNVKPLLRPGSNELRIRFGSAMHYVRTHFTENRPREINDSVGGCAVMRKEQCQFGWDWAPRLLTAGIWRDLRIEAWTANRLVDARVLQQHQRDGGGNVVAVALEVTPELARNDEAATYDVALSLDGADVAKTSGRRGALKLIVADPKLWWPAGQGSQPLYTIQVTARTGTGQACGSWTRRIGLRTLVLDRHPDQWGESFQFVVNGRPVFCKGAAWIPAHAFVAGLARADYARPLRAAIAANMNCLRLWGGGIYESEDFYDLCDEMGLLVWHDFMFACTLCPFDRAFLENVRAEAEYQVKRVRHHACLALWCGNNELAQLNTAELAEPSRRAGYEALFHHILPAVVAACDGVTSYWPTSQWHGNFDTVNDNYAGELRGDTHFWDVWFARKPVKEYEKYRFRFVSEFGMQSYSSPETQATFCPPENSNIFGAIMENHQKSPGGNQIILDYVSRRYRLPRSQEALIYLSQLNQAVCVGTGVEQYRRSMPRCMGALYWQLEDCWPVTSWSSVEYTGRWKALHYAARRFYAPALVTAEVPGDEVQGAGNYRKSTVREVQLYTVYDAPSSAPGLLRWDLFHLDGRVLQHGQKAVTLSYGESVRQQTLDLAEPMQEFGRDHLYLRLALDLGGECVSEKTVLLSPPRFLDLPRAKADTAVRMLQPMKATLSFTSPVYQHCFMFELPGLAHTATDNYFDLYPGERKDVTVDFAQPVAEDAVRARLRTQSLVDTYN